MVKRTPPLALGFIGTGETSSKNLEAQLNDFTSPYADVSAILPVDDEHWSDTMAAAFDWLVANEIPFVAVTDGSAGKELDEVLEKADSTIKVARVSTKMVALLADEKAEGEVALLVAWDDDDAEANIAVQKALDSEVPALNLLDGLDPFEFGDEDEEEHQEAKAEREQLESAVDDQGKTAKDRREERPTDDYDSWGIRKLRAELRERKSGMSDRAIGQMEKPEAIAQLRTLDADGEEPQGAAEPAQETRTTRARRAFAEGAAEGQDEARPLPRSKGSDILDNEDDTPAALDESIKAEPTQAASDTEYQDRYLRREALALAVQVGAGPDGVLPLAIKMETYLRGERQSAGRPRADGTPAQPREINEDGKPIRRRRSTSS